MAWVRARRRIDVAILQRKLAEVVEATPWVARYKEEGRFGLPLQSDDPLVKLNRAECVLGLHLLLYGDVDATANHAALRVADFIDEDRLEVLSSAVKP